MEIAEKDFPAWEDKDVYLYNAKTNIIHCGKLLNEESFRNMGCPLLPIDSSDIRWYVYEPVYNYMTRYGVGHSGGDYYVDEDTKVFTEAYEAYGRQLSVALNQLAELEKQRKEIEDKMQTVNTVKDYAERVIADCFKEKE